MNAKSGRLIVCLLLAGAMSVHAQNQPDPRAFQSALDRAQQAIGDGDPDDLMDATLDLHRQVVRMPEPDARLQAVTDLMPQILQGMSQGVDYEELVGYLEGLNALAAETAHYRNLPAWSVVRFLYETAMAGGEPGRARDVLRDVIEREERLVGPQYSQIRAARMWLAEAELAAGDASAALEVLDGLLTTTVGLYGLGAAETAEILAGMARAHLLSEEYAQAVERANQARDIVLRNPLRHVRLPGQLGSVYRSAANLDNARIMYALMETLMSADEPEVMVSRLEAQIALADLSARLGDGSSARRYLDTALELAQGIGAAARVRVLLLEASLLSRAGLFDEAAVSLAGLEVYATSQGLTADPAFVVSVARAYLHALAPDRAVALAEQALDLDLTSGLLREANLILAAAGALSDPPRSMRGQVEEWLEQERQQYPDRSHSWLQYVVALNLAAEGLLEESARLQREIIDAEAARTNRAMTTPLQWQTYAMVLEELDWTGDLGEVADLLERDRGLIREWFGAVEVVEEFLAETSGFGFEVDLEDSGWRRVRGGSINAPSSAFAATYSTPMHPDGGSFSVTPVFLPEGVNALSVIQAFAPRLNVDLTALERWRGADHEGYQLRAEYNAGFGQSFEQMVRVVVEPEIVYMLVGRVRASEPDMVSAVERAFDSLRLVPGASVEQLDAAESEQHGRIMNFVGVSFFDLGRFSEALVFYQEASKWLDEPFLLSNMASTYGMLEDHEQVVATAQRYEARYGPDPDILLLRADAHLNLSNSDAALVDYEAAFDRGATGDVHVANYVDLLMDRDRQESALAFLDSHQSDSLIIHVLQARIGFDIEDERRVNNALDVLLDPERSEPSAAFFAVTLIERRDGYGGLLRMTRQVIEDGLGSAELYARLATRQLQTGRYAEARGTLDEGLSAYPGNAELEAVAGNLADD